MSDAVAMDTTPALALQDGQPVALSLDVAAHFEKNHKDVLRYIKRIRVEDAQCEEMFEETCKQVETPQGGFRTVPVYRMNRDGFTLLAMGFTGAQALKWKLRYIEAFNAMEQELAQRVDIKPTQGQPPAQDMPARYRAIRPAVRAQILNSAVQTAKMQAGSDVDIMTTFYDFCELVAPAPKPSTKALKAGAPFDPRGMDSTPLFNEWADQHLVYTEGHKLPAGQAYTCFKAWFKENYRGKPPSHVFFGRWMQSNYERKQSNRMLYLNVALAQPEEIKAEAS